MALLFLSLCPHASHLPFPCKPISEVPGPWHLDNPEHILPSGSISGDQKRGLLMSGEANDGRNYDLFRQGCSLP